MMWLYGAPATARDYADLAGVDMIPEGIDLGWDDDSEIEKAGTHNMASGYEGDVCCNDSGNRSKVELKTRCAS